MSRIGKIPVLVPDKVQVKIEGDQVSVDGPNGHLDLRIPVRARVTLEDDKVVVTRINDEKASKAQHGLIRSLIQNMVTGVSTGFSKQLEIQGVGFKATMEGSKMVLNLGYSHPIHYEIPKTLQVTLTDGGTRIKIDGADKQLVGVVASEIRSYYPPEPYKGKGVRYSDEKVIRKEGKTVQ